MKKQKWHFPLHVFCSLEFPGVRRSSHHAIVEYFFSWVQTRQKLQSSLISFLALKHPSLKRHLKFGDRGQGQFETQIVHKHKLVVYHGTSSLIH
jgi:hypothetical protein